MSSAAGSWSCFVITFVSLSIQCFCVPNPSGVCGRSPAPFAPLAVSSLLAPRAVTPAAPLPSARLGFISVFQVICRTNEPHKPSGLCSSLLLSVLSIRGAGAGKPSCSVRHRGCCGRCLAFGLRVLKLFLCYRDGRLRFDVSIMYCGRLWWWPALPRDRAGPSRAGRSAGAAAAPGARGLAAGGEKSPGALPMVQPQRRGFVCHRTAHSGSPQRWRDLGKWDRARSCPSEPPSWAALGWHRRFLARTYPNSLYRGCQ